MPRVKKDKGKIRIIPLGGLHEIGKNLTVIEYENDMIAVDCGRSLRRDYLPAAGVFLAMVTLATVLNVVFFHLDGFHMFYMSPFHHTTFIFLDWVQDRHGWWPSMVIYLFAFLFLAALPLWFLGRVFIKKRENHAKRTKK